MNSEYRKCPSAKATHLEPTDDDMAMIPEDRLVDVLGNSTVRRQQTIVHKKGIV